MRTKLILVLWALATLTLVSGCSVDCDAEVDPYCV